MEQISLVFSKKRREGAQRGQLLCHFPWLPREHNQMREGSVLPGQHQARKGDSDHRLLFILTSKLHDESGGDEVCIQTHRLVINSGSEFSNIDSGCVQWVTQSPT